MNLDTSSDDRGYWQSCLQIHVGQAAVSLYSGGSIATAGSMSFFFLVVGLEARREFDIGESPPRASLESSSLVLAGLGGCWARSVCTWP